MSFHKYLHFVFIGSINIINPKETDNIWFTFKMTMQSHNRKKAGSNF